MQTIQKQIKKWAATATGIKNSGPVKVKKNHKLESYHTLGAASSRAQGRERQELEQVERERRRGRGSRTGPLVPTSPAAGLQRAPSGEVRRRFEKWQEAAGANAGRELGMQQGHTSDLGNERVDIVANDGRMVSSGATDLSPQSRRNVSLCQRERSERSRF